MSRQTRSLAMQACAEAMESRTLLSADSLAATQAAEPADRFLFGRALRNDTASAPDFSMALTLRAGRYRNEVGIYRVDDATGRIGKLRPGDAGYAKAALHTSRIARLFRGTDRRGATLAAQLVGGQHYGLYLIQKSNRGDFLRTNPANALAGKPLAFFSFAKANPDGFDHLRIRRSGDGYAFSWEDMTGGGDRDFNDSVITVKRTATAPASAIAASLANDTGGSASDGVTKDPSIAASVASPADTDVVQARITPGMSSFRTIPGLTPADFDSFTLDRADLEALLGGPLADGNYTIVLRTLKIATGSKRSASVSLALDTTPPAITLQLHPDWQFAGNPLQTMNPPVTLIGNTEPDLPVRLLSPVLATQSDAGGAFTFSNVPLAAGPNPLQADAEDLAGNVGTLNVTVFFGASA